MFFLLTLSILWFNGQNPVCYQLDKNTDPVVNEAVKMFCDDMQEVTGMRPASLGAGQASSATPLQIVQFDRSGLSARQLRALGVPSKTADSLSFVKEAFYIGMGKKTLANGQKPLLVIGSDARGTAYGILEMSRMAGVSPWIWWGDSHPQPQTQLAVDKGFSTFRHPSVAWRGIFLNDEDWAFRPWSTQTFAPTSDGRLSAAAYREIFRLLLRLRANTVWPAMHSGTTAFFQIPGALETADTFAISVGTSHCEPLLRNNVAEWDVARRGRFNYITNRQAVQDYWAERLQQVSHSGKDIFTLGMRGIHDGSMEGVKTLQEKTDALQQVIDDQREMLQKYVSPDVTGIPQVFIPYKEVLQIYENGLQVPDDVTLMWCDDNYGYLTRLSDAEQRKRSGGAGIYYHLSYAGRPHDVLWLCTLQPGLLYHEMRQAYDHEARRLWIANVHDPKVACYQLELFLDMAWNIGCVGASTVNAHLKDWLCREYGPQNGEKLAAPMAEFFRLCAIRKPEFMGWSQVELDKNTYPRGFSPVQDTEWSFSEFGNEAERYLQAFAHIRRQVEDIYEDIPDIQKDAYFAAVLYPVSAAADMAEKHLCAQQARALAQTSYSPTHWGQTADMDRYCARSQRAYQDIRRLSRHYNETMSGGKWNRLMSDHPRDLYVFRPAQLPQAFTEDEIEIILKDSAGTSADVKPLSKEGKDYLARQACEFDRSTCQVRPVQNLGHSAQAVPLPVNAILQYDFQSEIQGDALLRVALIPTQANDKGDIRFALRIDEGEWQEFSLKEPFRSEGWKQNVMRGQARVEVPVTLQSGTHRLELKALDEHIVFDQWMIDAKSGRKFYQFPLEP